MVRFVGTAIVVRHLPSAGPLELADSQAKGLTVRASLNAGERGRAKPESEVSFFDFPFNFCEFHHFAISATTEASGAGKTAIPAPH